MAACPTTKLTPELLANLKKGQNLVVQAINSNGAPLTLAAAAAGSRKFAKAYDGPPTDPKVFEENQKKLQEELQKRAEEAREKLSRRTSRTARHRQSGREVAAQRVSRSKEKAPGSGAFSFDETQSSACTEYGSLQFSDGLRGR